MIVNEQSVTVTPSSSPTTVTVSAPAVNVAITSTGAAITVSEQVINVSATNLTGTAITVAPVSVVVTVAPGATSFLGLSDTPDAYAGQGGKAVAVNTGATGLEFVTFSGGVTDHGLLTGLSDNDHPQYALLAAANTFVLGPNLFKAGADGNVALSARRHSSGATANIFEVQDENGAAILHASYDGTFGIGANTDTHDDGFGSAAIYNLYVRGLYQTNPDSAPGSYIELMTEKVFARFDLTSKPAGQYIFAAGLNFSAATRSTSVGVPDELHGILGTVNHGANLPIAYVDGGNFNAQQNSTGVIGQLVGIVAGVQNVDSTVVDAFGVLVNAQASLASGVTAGVYVQSQAGYALYTDGGAHRFGDYLDLAEISTPSAPSNTHGRLFCRDNAGKTELCFRAATGSVIVIVAEP